MKKIHKLILKAYMGPMFVTFFIVQFVLMMNFVWRYIDELTGKGLEVGTIVELLACATANMIPLGLPLSMLLSAIMAMGNLGESFELLAMKSAGVSLVRIFRPLIILVSFIAVGSFFITNNLVPYANQRMYDIIFDIREQRQEMKFNDGMFFNGLPDMSIRVGHQDENSSLVQDVLIFDTRATNGNMTTTLADSGYIRMSPDKSYLYVTLYNGDTYEHTRSYQWYDNSTLRHHSFERQEGTFPVAKVAMRPGDMSKEFSEAQTRNIVELEELIDSLNNLVDINITKSYAPFYRDRVFPKDTLLMGSDSLRIDKSNFRPINIYDSIERLSIRDKAEVYTRANSSARVARGAYTYDEQTMKVSLTQLHRAENEWHRKMTLPLSIILFFMIGAPLGAIIRKGGLGMPIVISVIFFVIYYIVSISGEKLSAEGTWEAMYGMWLPIIVLTPIALYLTHRATNDAPLVNVDWFYRRFHTWRRSISKRIPEKMKIGKYKKSKRVNK